MIQINFLMQVDSHQNVVNQQNYTFVCMHSTVLELNGDGFYDGLIEKFNDY